MVRFRTQLRNNWSNLPDPIERRKGVTEGTTGSLITVEKLYFFSNFQDAASISDFLNFDGKVMHFMDYSNLDNETAAVLIKGKRITVIGSPIDLAAECAKWNRIY
ncbi:hypothetical protein VIGAN_01147000 [Vigna angularis var. angularis]|uniref:Uncharacterized protein n=1 Tax=Vigna angularis var. angularis TaxID=157739 RepID=A0A0S3R001_PHAAN|nr:hypothetical protein VIGAN_01147000 [Vigna angularis var. angularis]